MPSGLHAYAGILLPEGAWRFSLAGWFARLFRVGISVGVVMLVVGASGDYALAGVAGGAAVVASAVAAPAWSLAADRLGQTRVIPFAIVVALVATALLVWTVESGAERPLWVAAAFFTGLGVLDGGAVVRARWLHRLEDGPARQTALALESAIDELAFLIGLPVVALAAGLAGASAALLGAAALSGAGYAALAAMRSSAPPVSPRGSAARPSGLRAWLPPGVLAPLPAFIGIGLMFGTMNVSGVAITEAAGRPELAGVVVATFSLGAVGAGLAWGVIARAWTARRRIAIAAALYAAAVPVLLLAREPVGYAVAVAVVGVGAGTLLVAAFSAVEWRAPRDSMTVAMAWPPVAISIGSTAGAILAGHAIDTGGAYAGWWIPMAGALLGVLGAIASSTAGGDRVGQALRD